MSLLGSVVHHSDMNETKMADKWSPRLAVFNCQVPAAFAFALIADISVSSFQLSPNYWILAAKDYLIKGLVLQY